MPAYESGLDGLRGIAVLSVFVYHLSEAWLPGGFTGVDVFFVLSGFLITRNILGELRLGDFSLVRFYQRRIARILPALFVMCAAALAAACWLYSGQDRAMTGAHFLASMLSYANMRSIAMGNYFELSADTQPLMHCWSLSVEEQFYFVFPLALAWVYRRRLTLAFTVAMAAVSFGLCMWLTAARPVWAFYILPARAWELLTGALLAHATLDDMRRPGLVAFLGLAGVCASFWFVREGPWFPGGLAVLPVLSTAAVVAALMANGQGAAIALLRSAPLVRAGKLSYSLYLWHWPVFSFVDYALLTWSDASRSALKVGLSTALAYLSFTLVEAPLRHGLARSRRGAYGLALLVLALSVPAGSYVRREFYVNASPADIAAGGVVFNPGGAGTVALLGDSTATMYGTVVRDASLAVNARFVAMGVAGAGAFPGGPAGGVAIWEQSLKNLAALEPDVCVVSYLWTARVQQDPAFVATVLAAVRPLARRVIFVTAVPKRPKDGSPAAIRAGSRPPFAEDADDRPLRLASDARLREALGPDVTLVDAGGVIATPDGVRCLDDALRPVFLDTAHLSGFGTALVEPALRAAVAQALRR